MTELQSLSLLQLYQRREIHIKEITFYSRDGKITERADAEKALKDIEAEIKRRNEA